MLIIYAHPNHDGHCGYILKQIKKELSLKEVEYRVLDLYEEKYDPILKQKEHYTSGNFHLAKETLKYQELIKNERRFIIIYPTWWDRTPAILKGFFDRILTNKFAFSFNVFGIPKGHLKGRVSVITTTGGRIFIEKFIRRNCSLRVVTKEILGFCGLKTKGFKLGNANKLKEKNKKKIHKIVAKAIKYTLK